MTRVIPERDVRKGRQRIVVFLIGMRINKPWKIHKWLPVFLAMPKMLDELKKRPDSGLLGVESAGLTIIQYWRSFEALGACCAQPQYGLHWPAWLAFNSGWPRPGDVGIWHETYQVAAGRYGGDLQHAAAWPRPRESVARS